MIKKQREDFSSKNKTADPMLYDTLREYADENRKNPTLAEDMLWQILRRKGMGVKFRRQHAIGAFIADFVCLDEQLVIEVDGGYHETPEQREDDELRTAILNQMGYRVLRFTNDEVLYHIDDVRQSILRQIIFTDINNQ